MLPGIFCTASAAPSTSPDRPNFLVILVDDMGLSDLGAFGGEIETPNLDDLARRGMRFSNFYSAPACSPTRAELLTGVDHHIGGIGQMDEVLAPPIKGKPGYEGYLNKSVATVAERLAESGYDTLYSGKWHLGHNAEQSPAARGFRKSFALLPGGSNHFGTEMGIQTNATNSPYLEDGVPVTRLPETFYSSDYFTDKLISYLDQSQSSGKPFFAYLAYTAPHWALQAPASSITKYRGRYDQGFNALRAERLRGLEREGLIGPALTPHPMVGEMGYGWVAGFTKDWPDLTPEERAIEARKMEVYAAMVDRVDWNIGKLLQALKRLGALDNTVIIFLSDNGAEGGNYNNVPLGHGGTFGGHIAKRYDNRLENIGAATSLVWYGPRWAQAATAPYRHHKAHTTEGGIRVPAFVTYAGFHRQGSVSPALATVRDITPTILDLAGIAPSTTYQGQKVAPITGKSMAPFLNGKSGQIHASDAVFVWELHTHRAVRQGYLKAVFIPPPEGRGDWQLYDLATDPTELNDLARQESVKLARLTAHWDRYAEQNNILATPDFRMEFAREQK